MEQTDNLKQRLVGAAALISLVVVFLPMLVDDGPGPHPDRPAVPPRPDWQFSDWQGGEYQVPALPRQPASEIIDPGPIATSDDEPTSAQINNGAGNTGSRQAAAQAPAAGDSASQRGGTPTDKPDDLLEATVKSGDTLYGIFRRLGLEPSQVREVVKVRDAGETLSRLRPGQRFRIRVDGRRAIVAMEYLHSGGPALRIKRIGGRLQAVSGGQQTVAKRATTVKPVSNKPPRSQPRSPSAPSVEKTPRPTREQGPVAWAVQVGVYDDWNAARGLQAKLRGKGYTAFVKSEEKNGKKFWRLKVGPQLKKTDAVALARKIQRETGSKTQVVGYP